MTDIALQGEDPAIAELLKPLGCTTGPFGKKRLGDKDEFLPTNHRLNGSFENLYHLSPEKEPETSVYPKDPEFYKRFASRDTIYALPEEKLEDTGLVTRKRMVAVAQEFADAGLKFIDKAGQDKVPRQ